MWMPEFYAKPVERCGSGQHLPSYVIRPSGAFPKGPMFKVIFLTRYVDNIGTIKSDKEGDGQLQKGTE